jgi:hypothetical protein
MWNKTPMKPLGEANLTVKNPSTGNERIITLEHFSQQVCRFHVSRHLAATTVIFGTVTFSV